MASHPLPSGGARRIPANSTWIQLLPPFLRSRLDRRHKLQAILSNTAWLFADRLLRMGGALVVGVWMARYLGPHDYGVFQYALAFATLFSAIGTLGLSQIVVRDVVREQASANEILGTAFVLKIAAGVVAFGLTTAAIVLPGRNDAITVALVVIMAGGMAFQAFDTIDFWFQATMRSKYTVYARNVSFFLIMLGKAALIVFKAPLIAFGCVAAAELPLTAISLLTSYRINGGHVRAWRISKERAKILMRDGWPLVLSEVMITLYTRIDQIMIGDMIGPSAVGVYSAAFRIMQVWYFIPTAISVSVFPSIIEAKGVSERLYYSRLQRLYTLMTWLGLALAAPISFLSDRIVATLFGARFQEAGSVLIISCWAAIFLFQGVARGRWLVTENLQRYSYWYIGAGAAVNVCLNWLWIPTYGIQGAAWATLISQATVAIGAPLLFRETRISAIMLLKSFLPWYLWRADPTDRPAPR